MAKKEALTYAQLKMAAKVLNIKTSGKKTDALKSDIERRIESISKAAATKVSEAVELAKRAESVPVKVAKKVVGAFRGFHPITGELIE